MEEPAVHMRRDAPLGFIQAASPLVELFCFFETGSLSLCSPGCTEVTILYLLAVFNMISRVSTPSKKGMEKRKMEVMHAPELARG